MAKERKECAGLTFLRRKETETDDVGRRGEKNMCKKIANAMPDKIKKTLQKEEENRWTESIRQQDCKQQPQCERRGYRGTSVRKRRRFMGRQTEHESTLAEN